MGPTSGGKTTIAHSLYNSLIFRNIPVVHYDGDEFRDLFGSSFGFKEENRLKVVKVIVHFSNKSIKSGVNVIVSALTANPDARSYVMENVCNLVLCYVKCPIDVCIRRDPKGLYKLAQQGDIDTLIGYILSMSLPTIRILS